MDIDDYDTLLGGLQALAESAFPKHCQNCGRTFESAEQFLRETESVGKSRSGLKESEDDDGTKIVEAFRNCPCGSTLMDFFTDRRDVSEVGLRRRERFEELLTFLVGQGLELNQARTELLKVVRGQKSDLLAGLRPPS